MVEEYSFIFIKLVKIYCEKKIIPQLNVQLGSVMLNGHTLGAK